MARDLFATKEDRIVAVNNLKAMVSSQGYLLLKELLQQNNDELLRKLGLNDYDTIEAFHRDQARWREGEFYLNYAESVIDSLKTQDMEMLDLDPYD